MSPSAVRPSAEYPALPTWSEVLAAALVGTSRSGQPAETLLDAAAAHALRRRAGTVLLGDVTVPLPAPPDEAPLVGAAAAARGGDLLAFDDPTRAAGPLRELNSRLDLLTEWLAAAAAAGRRLPPELVPALLDAGRRHRVLRPFIAAVAGARAGWLAAQRPDWSYAANTDAIGAAEDRAPWPHAVVEAVFAALEEPLVPASSGRSGPGGWRIAALCELAALRLPADCAPRAAVLAERLRTVRASDPVGPRRLADPGLAIIERFAVTLRYRQDMLEEFA